MGRLDSRLVVGNANGHAGFFDNWDAMEEFIIASVYKREPLWNPSHSLYRNVGVLKKLWQEVANELNTDGK